MEKSEVLTNKLTKPMQLGADDVVMAHDGIGTTSRWHTPVQNVPLGSFRFSQKKKALSSLASTSAWPYPGSLSIALKHRAWS
jgi:hypothetical protein